MKGCFRALPLSYSPGVVELAGIEPATTSVEGCNPLGIRRKKRKGDEGEVTYGRAKPPEVCDLRIAWSWCGSHLGIRPKRLCK